MEKKRDHQKGLLVRLATRLSGSPVGCKAPFGTTDGVAAAPLCDAAAAGVSLRVGKSAASANCLSDPGL